MGGDARARRADRGSRPYKRGGEFPKCGKMKEICYREWRFSGKMLKLGVDKWGECGIICISAGVLLL